MFESICHYQGFLGILIFTIIAVLLSENRRQISYKSVFWGIKCQFLIFVILTKAPMIKDGFLKVASAICSLKEATDYATAFVFGYVGGGVTPFEITSPSAVFILAFQALPMLIVMSALSMLLFHWRVIPLILKGMSFLLKRVSKLGGALGMVASSKIFVGQTEVPFLIRPYLSKLSKHELFTVITCGMATTSGAVIVLYGTILNNVLENAVGHILTVTIMSVFSAIWVSRIIVPETNEPTQVEIVNPYNFSSSMDAISKGTTDGLKLWANIVAMLIVTLALIKLLNIILGCLPNLFDEPITIERILGVIMAPVTWLMGIPWGEATLTGNLLGTKTVLNEIVAFLKLSEVSSMLSPKSRIIMTYGLCGFANISSIGIVIGIFGGLVPERKDEVIKMCFKAMIAGSIATCLSGTVVGILFNLFG